MGIPILLGRDAKNQSAQDESDCPLFFWRENKDLAVRRFLFCGHVFLRGLT